MKERGEGKVEAGGGIWSWYLCNVSFIGTCVSFFQCHVCLILIFPSSLSCSCPPPPVLRSIFGVYCWTVVCRVLNTTPANCPTPISTTTTTITESNHILEHLSIPPLPNTSVLPSPTPSFPSIVGPMEVQHRHPFAR